MSLRTQELALVMGAPGAGKSTVAVNIAMAVDCPILYLAQDTPRSVLSRMAAIATGKTIRDIQQMMSRTAGRQHLTSKLADTRPTLVFQPGQMTIDGIERRLEALTEWLGKAPPLVIVDNLIDLNIGGLRYQDPNFYAEALPAFKRLAQEHDTCIMALHHVLKLNDATNSKVRAKGEGVAPLNLNDCLQGGPRASRHVWGVYRDTSNSWMSLQVLKQQDGPASPSGDLKVQLRWYPETARLVEPGG